MHEHNTDLIMALADSTLDPSDRAAAEADIAACAECTEHLELQRVALGLLRAAPPVAMNDIERAHLHRTLRDELGLAAPQAAAAAAGAARRYRVFAGLAGAAAVLVAVVAIAPGLNLFGGGDDASAPFEAAFGADTTVTDGAADSAADNRSLTEEAGDGGSAEAPTQEMLDELAAAATTSAPATAAAPLDVDTLVGPAAGYTYWASEELSSLPDLRSLADELVAEKSLESVLGPQADDVAERLAALDEERCLELGLAAAPGSTEAFVVAVSTIGDVEVVIVAYVHGDFADVTLVAHDVETCKVLATS